MTPLVKVPGFPVMTRAHLGALAALNAAVAGLATVWPPVTIPAEARFRLACPLSGFALAMGACWPELRETEVPGG